MNAVNRMVDREREKLQSRKILSTNVRWVTMKGDIQWTSKEVARSRAADMTAQESTEWKNFVSHLESSTNDNKC